MITINWDDRILLKDAHVTRIQFRSQYLTKGGDIPTREAYFLEQPTEQPATITIEAKDLIFSEISNLKGIFYNSVNYSSPAGNRSGTLWIGTRSYDNCNIEFFSFTYTKVFSRNLFAAVGSKDNIGIWGDVKLRFNRWLAY